MQPKRSISLREIEGDLKTYFNWSANALMPLRIGAAHVFLKENSAIIQRVSQKLLKQVNYNLSPIFRGIIVREPLNFVQPQEHREYLSFSTDRKVAEHFANIKGFGSNILDVSEQLGKYGYVIEYFPQKHEVLFHYRFLSILPYAEAFALLNMNGLSEVEELKKQKEVIIFQPNEPFTNIIKK